MAENKLFSIIMPCYNVEDYVDRAIRSVMAQTVDKSLFELITVNDASTDDTLKHLYEWANRFPNTVKVITYDTNIRQGGARNLALKASVGEYICFLDSDDWIEPDALESYLTVLNVEKWDIITTKHEENYEYGIIYGNDTKKKDIHIVKSFSSGNIRDYIQEDLGFVWASIYRRTIILDNKVVFPEHMAYEDICWQRLIKYYASRACITNKLTHHHFNHPGSTMNSKNARHHIDRLASYEMLLKELSERNLLTISYSDVLRDTIETYYFNSYYMFFTRMDDIPDVYKRIRSTIYEYFPDWEVVYDDSDIPMVFQYMIKLLKKVAKASPDDLKPFKDSILELIEN